MLETIKSQLLRLLRVPAEPTAPEGGQVIRVFRAAPNYFRLKMILWGVGEAGTLVGLLFGLFFVGGLLDWVTHPVMRGWLIGVEAVAWALYLAHIPITLALLRLDFEMRWYILSDRSLRIREGVLSVQEKTFTFANIQQISIRQNPLQRLLNIADVQVRTAGGGGGVGESMHEAYFRGVDNAEEIRTAIKERVRLHRDAGLGDPDEPAPLAVQGQDETLAAAIELRGEMRALRQALTA